VYEGLACGALVISEHRPELNTLCPEVPVFRSIEEMESLIEFYLRDANRFAHVRRACIRRFASQTYAARLANVFRICFGEPETTMKAAEDSAAQVSNRIVAIRKQEPVGLVAAAGDLGGSWTRDAEVVRIEADGSAVLQKVLDEGPGTEQGLIGNACLKNLLLEFDVYLQGGSIFLAKIHQLEATNQQSNSYHLICRSATAYLARHNHVFCHFIVPMDTWFRVSISYFDGEIVVCRNGAQVAQVREQTLEAGYCFLGVKGGVTRLREISLKTPATPSVKPLRVLQEGLGFGTLRSAPMVSIVTTVYDRVECLENCLKSVQGINFSEYEHIVIADSPPSRILQQIEKLVAHYTRKSGKLTFDTLKERTNDWGVSPAAAGLALARGKYICFLSDDNGYMPHHFDSLVPLLESNPTVGFAYSSCLYDGRVTLRSPVPRAGAIDLGQPLFRRELFARYLGNTLPFHEFGWDWRVIETFLRNGVRCQHVDDATFVFRLAKYPHLINSTISRDRGWISSVDAPVDQPHRGDSGKSAARHALAAKRQWKDDYVPRSSEFLDARRVAVKAIAFYLPQFYPIPENDLWWGKNFTEWKNVAKATPRFVGHYQPQLPGEQGFYDLRVPEILAEQTEIATQYGISAFCFHYYWFSGKRLLEKPLEQFLANPALDIGLCICWANENWTRRWDGLEHDVLIAQEYSPDHDRELIESLLPVFRDPRYVHINGSPLFLVYRINLLPDPVGTIVSWRDAAKAAGFPDLFVAAVLSFDIRDVKQYGADAAVEFPPHQTAPERITELQPLADDLLTDGAVFDYVDVARRFGKFTSDSSRVFKCVMPGWDNTARRGSQSVVFHGSAPAVYAEWLKDSCELAYLNSIDQRLVFINAWNEWAEGAHLESDARYGYAYLNATANVLRNYYHDPLAEDFIAQNNNHFRRRSDVAIILHAYYEDLGREIVDEYIASQSKGADVFVSVRPDVSLHFLAYLNQSLNNVLFLRQENRGRDVRPFLFLLRRLTSFHYKYACKVHTKRSPHREDGEKWGRSLMSPLLGGSDAISLVEQRFADDKNLGLLVPSNSLVDLSIEEINAGNRSWLDKLLPKIGCADLVGSYRALFPAGSMYWFRLEALAGLEDLVLGEDAFELEVGQLDGSLAHALERIIVLYASARGYKAKEFNSLDAHVGVSTEIRQ
jgi:lipopolysaccharide biosynthesis protein